MLQRLVQLVIPVLILAGGAAGLFWLSALKEPPVRVSVPYQPPVVETETVVVQTESFPIRIHGVVVPHREIRIAAEVSGRIVDKHERLRSGHVVTEDTRLLAIDPEPYRLTVESLDQEAKQVEIDTQRIDLDVEQTAELVALSERKLALAMRELERLDKLAAQDSTTQAARDEAERTVLDARSGLTVLKQRQAQLPLQRSGLVAKSEMLAFKTALARIDLARTEIVAPLDAIVTADAQEVGSYVEAGDHLVTLQDVSHFEVSCSLRADDLLWLHASTAAAPFSEATLRTVFELPETAANVTYEIADESYSWTGRLIRAEGMGFDATTRTLACRVIVDEPRRDGVDGPPALVAGMFVDVAFEVTPQIELLSLPRSALQPDGQVWLVNDGKLTVHQEQPARVTSSTVFLRVDRTEIRPGDRVVVSTLPMAFSGMDVRERPAP